MTLGVRQKLSTPLVLNSLGVFSESAIQQERSGSAGSVSRRVIVTKAVNDQRRVSKLSVISRVESTRTMDVSLVGIPIVFDEAPTLIEVLEQFDPESGLVKKVRERHVVVENSVIISSVTLPAGSDIVDVAGDGGEPVGNSEPQSSVRGEVVETERRC